MAKKYNTEGLRASYPGIMLDTFDFVFPGLTKGITDFFGVSDTVDRLRNDEGGIISRLYNDITGKTAQQREFEQQEYLQDKMNAYNTPAAQMERFEQAGFNRDLAAQAVLGGNAGESAQAPSVPSAAGAAAAGGAAIGQTATQAAKLPAEIEAVRADADAKDAAAKLDVAKADEIGTLKNARLNGLIATAAKDFADAGLTKQQSNLMAIKLVFAGQNELIDLYSKFASLGKLQKEIDILGEEFKKRKNEVAISGEELQQAEIDTWFQQERKRIYTENGFDPTLPFDNMLLEASANGQADAVMDVVYERSYNESKGSFDADADTAWKRFKEQVEGSNFAKKQDAAFFAKIENSKELFKVIADLYLSPDGGLSSLGNRIISLIGAEFGLDPKELTNWIKDAYSSDVR